MSPTAQSFLALVSQGKEAEAYAALEQQLESSQPDPVLVAPELRRAAWNQIVAAAERHYDPGRFTTLIGWEWSGAPGGASLHRVVMLREGRDVASRLLPFSAFDGARPEDLWAWLEATAAETGATFLAIPHASGTSRGLMFVARDASGEPVTAPSQRARTGFRAVLARERCEQRQGVERHPSHVVRPTDLAPGRLR
jgi:hypothetical protein